MQGSYKYQQLPSLVKTRLELEILTISRLSRPSFFIVLFPIQQEMASTFIFMSDPRYIHPTFLLFLFYPRFCREALGQRAFSISINLYYSATKNV